MFLPVTGKTRFAPEAALIRLRLDSVLKQALTGAREWSYLTGMRTLSVAEVRAGFGRITRKVLKTRKPVIVATKEGLVQIAPYDLNEAVPPAPRGSLHHTEQEIWLHNNFGESL